MARVILAGGTGFLGKQIAARLRAQGDEVLTLGRSESADLQWSGDWAEALGKSQAIINLSGESVAQQWNLDAQQRILKSRTESTLRIGQAISECATPPDLWINTSAIGIYGNRGDDVLTEASPPGNPDEFLVKVGLEWEAAQAAFALERTKKAIIRIGVVLGHGGALPKLVSLTKAFLGGAVGDGKQYVSWIHESDIVSLFAYVLNHSKDGVFNGTAPHPATNGELMATLRKLLHRPALPPVPGFALRLASTLGAPDPDILLHSQRVIPERTLESGFKFEFPDLEPALRSLI